MPSSDKQINLALVTNLQSEYRIVAVKDVREGVFRRDLVHFSLVQSYWLAFWKLSEGWVRSVSTMFLLTDSFTSLLGTSHLTLMRRLVFITHRVLLPMSIFQVIVAEKTFRFCCGSETSQYFHFQWCLKVSVAFHLGV